MAYVDRIIGNKIKRRNEIMNIYIKTGDKKANQLLNELNIEIKLYSNARRDCKNLIDKIKKGNELTKDEEDFFKVVLKLTYGVILGSIGYYKYKILKKQKE